MIAGELVFVDTNVLLYVFDGANQVKHAAARNWVDHLWSSGCGRLSWQVLNECYENAVRKIGAPPRLVRAAVETYADWGMAQFSLPMLQRAWYWTDRAGLRYWDALILAAAEATGCRYLLSEDFQEGRSYGSVHVINPFHADPAAFLLQ
jgi:predicted nucleic acid-binding protein